MPTGTKFTLSLTPLALIMNIISIMPYAPSMIITIFNIWNSFRQKLPYQSIETIVFAKPFLFDHKIGKWCEMEKEEESMPLKQTLSKARSNK